MTSLEAYLPLPRMRRDVKLRPAISSGSTAIDSAPAGAADAVDAGTAIGLHEVFADSVTPILVSDYTFTEDNFYSATSAVRDGKMFDNEGWTHQPGSNTVGWIKTYGNSPIAYIQGGDDPEAYENEHYRQLLENTIAWAASSEALNWAKGKLMPNEALLSD